MGFSIERVAVSKRGYRLGSSADRRHAAPFAARLTGTLSRWAACLIFLVVSAFPALVLGQVVVGNQQVLPQIDGNPAGMAEAFRTTATGSGSIVSLTVYVDSTSTATRLVVGLYANSGSRPGLLLTQASLTSPIAGAWNTVNVPNTNVTSGATYWIAVLGPAGSGLVRFRDNHTGAPAVTSAQTTLTTLPSSWTTGSVYGDSPLSAYGSASGSPQPILSVNPTSLSFNFAQGGSGPAPKSLNVGNSGGGTLTFTASDNASWLAVSPATGTAPQSEQVTATGGGLAVGTYNGQVTITASGAQGSPAVIPVTLTVTAAAPQPVLSVTPASLSFSHTQGGSTPPPAAMNVTNTGTGTLNFTASDNASWLSVTPATGTAPQSGQITAIVAGLAPGTYNGQVTITASGAQGSPAVIPVTLTISAPAPQPILSVTPSSLAFSYTVGGTVPSPASLNVTNTGTGTVNFSASDNAAWLSVLPATGTAPQSEQVTATVSGLAVGTYTGEVTITASGAQGSPAVVPVTLTVNDASSISPDWPMVGRDPSRSGYAANDSVISKDNVANLQLQWSAGVDGKVTAQPLFVNAVQVGGQTRDVVIAATTANSIYALDANTGAQLWSRNFGPNMGGCVIPGGTGIRGAPVIDRTSARIYVVSDDGSLRTVSLVDGTQVVAPVPIIDLPGTNKVRGGLNLFGGNLYIASGSDGCDNPPWRGRVYRVDVSGSAPALTATFEVIPGLTGDNRGGGIWGYGGVSIDPATGNVMAATGADRSTGYTPYGDRLLSISSALTLQGSFEPPHPTTYPCEGAPCDVDFGATPIVFQPAGCPTLVAAGNKNGELYLLRAADLATSGAPLQTLRLNPANDWLGNGGVGGVPAYWPDGRMLFITDAGPGVTGIAAGVVALAVQPAPACTLAVAWSAALPHTGRAMSSPTVAGGVVFVGEGGGGRVRAYDAATGAELWNSGAIIGGSTPAAPSIAAGKVFVGSWNGLGAADAGTVRAFAPGPPPPPPGPCVGATPAVLFGAQTVESQVDSVPLGTGEAFQTTATGCGTVGSLTVYLDGTSNASKVTVGLYADTGSHPGSLLGQGSSTLLTPGAWNTIPIAPVNVTQGTKYWIAILGTQSGTVRFRDRKGGCKSETSATTTLTALPAVWATVWCTTIARSRRMEMRHHKENCDAGAEPTAAGHPVRRVHCTESVGGER